MTYELVYGNGGHGGPYPTLESAEQNSKRLLLGSPTETHIYIVPRSAPSYSRQYAVQTVSKQESANADKGGVNEKGSW